MKILDASCGTKGIWHQKNHPFVTFLDKRTVNGKKSASRNKPKNRRIIRIKPDILADWSSIPFKDEVFDMIVFDPPHLIRSRDSGHIFIEKYGMFNKSNYKAIMKESISELFRVLKEEGVFIFKWNDCDKKVNEILPLFPYKPMFGTRVGKNENTHWILFIKHRFEKQLKI